MARIGLCFGNHPRYSLRRFIIISSILGVFISVIVNQNTKYDIASNALVSIFWLFASIVISLWDLIDWRLKNATILSPNLSKVQERQPLLAPATDDLRGNNEDGDNDDNDPKDTPRMLIVLMDLLLFVALTWVWCIDISDLTEGYNWDNIGWRPHRYFTIVLATYGSITLILSAIAHACCFWKQLMVLKQQTWIRSINQKRYDWQEQINRFLDAAAQNHATRASQLNYNASSASCHCTCACPCVQSGSGATLTARDETNIMNRLMKVLGKLPADYETLDKDEEAVDTATIRPATHHNIDTRSIENSNVDIEAGPSYRADSTSILTPSVSTSEPHDTTNNLIDTLHISGPMLNHTYQPPIPTSEKAKADDVEPVLVKKKGRNLRKEKSRESDCD